MTDTETLRAADAAIAMSDELRRLVHNLVTASAAVDLVARVCLDSPENEDMALAWTNLLNGLKRDISRLFVLVTETGRDPP